MTALLDFPTDFSTALILVAHPDDPEYGMSAAVARWTSEGRKVFYALASSGEAGIEGLAPAECGPLREGEQRASAAVVGVDHVEFWGFPDSDIRNTGQLRAKVVETITRLRPDVVITGYGGAEWAPGMPNQRDHMEFTAAVVQAWDSMATPPRWLFVNGPSATHAVEVGDFVETAVNSLAAHDRYLSVLDPQTPVREQARKQVAMMAKPREDFGGAVASAFELVREGRA
ncbi:PIG-L family deacetylase [Gordonia sp. TBRC 11910]|uniref:PIG-L family deacetylase n=1 Tax=Gordonia asplenii TaxID=2725283 RepID=A0A848L1I3_9ACTN|nr:PIG-L family deacetylase [Gordonia asplenii]NMO02381.1 PIG-L family deacetylase [Gordonia asplenii]